MRGAIPNIEEGNSDKMRQRIAALKRTIVVLDNRAAMADGLARDLDNAGKRLSTVEAEVVNLRSRLEVTNQEILRLRSTERPAAGILREGLDSVSSRLLQTMESFEKKVTDHVRTYVRLQSDPLGRRSCPATGDANSGGLAPEDAMEVESPRFENDNRVPATSWSGVVAGRRVWIGPNSSRLQAPPVSSLESGRRMKTPARGMGCVPPRSSPAVLIESLEGGVCDAEMVKRVRDRVSPKDYGIDNIRTCQAANGGVMLEVLDPGVALDRVDALAGAIGSIKGLREHFASGTEGRIPTEGVRPHDFVGGTARDRGAGWRVLRVGGVGRRCQTFKQWSLGGLGHLSGERSAFAVGERIREGGMVLGQYRLSARKETAMLPLLGIRPRAWRL